MLFSVNQIVSLVPGLKLTTDADIENAWSLTSALPYVFTVSLDH